MLQAYHVHRLFQVMYMSSEEHVYEQEIQAMKVVAAALAGLRDDRARSRVLRWALEHFPAQHDARSRPDRGFETLADLFAAAEPRRERDKALVSAYWFQRQAPSGSFTAQEINKGLKDLGHRVVNITGALGDLAEQSPRLVAQLEKAGTTRQARKLYRLTPAGTEAVTQMLKTRS
jgi:hypothetical protein